MDTFRKKIKIYHSGTWFAWLSPTWLIFPRTEDEQTWDRDNPGGEAGIGFGESAFSIHSGDVIHFRGHFPIHVNHWVYWKPSKSIEGVKMIYFLHNSQTGRVQQSPSLEQFEGPDRAAFMNMLRRQWLNRDVMSGNGSTGYRICRS